MTVDYFRPSARGRKIFNNVDGLLPSGEPWRTGANAATKFTFSDTVNIGENKVAPGSYAIISIPNSDTWSIQWYSYESNNWTTYLNEKPIFTTEVPVQSNHEMVETLEIRFQSATLNSAVLIIEWERMRLNIPLRVNEQKEILRSITKVLEGPRLFEHYQAALYLHESNGNLQQALAYIRKVTQAPDPLFFQVTREAMILRDMGRRSEAVKSARRALELSKEAQNQDFIRLNERIIREN